MGPRRIGVETEGSPVVTRLWEVERVLHYLTVSLTKVLNDLGRQALEKQRRRSNPGKGWRQGAW